MSDQITVIIPCKDERHHLPGAIASARLVADEVLVADSGSTDGTKELATEHGCRVIEREYRTSGDFKNWAIPQASHPWVLILDADERVTPQLAVEIRQKLTQSANLDGFWVPRVNCFFGRPLYYGGWKPGSLLRLFRRERGRYDGDTDHAVIEMASDRTRQLRGHLLHDAVWSYERYQAKLDRYALVQAELWAAEGRKTNFWQLFFRGPLRFGQDFILRRGFLDGLAGLQSAVLIAYGSYLKQARLWELSQKVPAEGSILDLPKSELAKKRAA